MSQNYARGVPMGNNQIPFQNCPPAVKAIGQYFTENAATSSVITLTQDTTAIEITNTAANRAVAIRWIATGDTAASVTSANYDHAVAANTTRRFVVPIEAINNADGYSSAVGANRSNGLFQRVAWISFGPASILGSEYGSSNSY